VNGDDRPLGAIRIRVLHRPARLLVAGGFPKPYTLRYGAPRLHAPVYDFARLPVRALGLAHASDATLGGERVLAHPAPRSPRAYGWLAVAALALAAVAVGVAGFVVLRRKTAP